MCICIILLLSRVRGIHYIIMYSETEENVIFFIFFFNMDVLILLSVVLKNMCGSHTNLIVYCWRTERQYVTICPCVPSNRQPTSCDLSSVVTLDFNKLSGGIRKILYYRVWSLVKRMFWEGIKSTHWKYIPIYLSTPTHVSNI